MAYFETGKKAQTYRILPFAHLSLPLPSHEQTATYNAMILCSHIQSLSQLEARNVLHHSELNHLICQSYLR